jgi:hypothetical protein
MAKKSKGFNELLIEQKWVQSQGKALAKLQERMRSEQGSNVSMVATDPKTVKISTALKDLVEPYEPFCHNQDDMENLIRIGMWTWNLTVIPAKKTKVLREKLLEFIILALSHTNIAAAEILLDQLLARKAELYPDDQRLITDFQLEYVAKGYYHISAAWGMPPSS